MGRNAVESAPRVAIVVPTFRRPQFLERAVASVRAQTVASWELIIVDDNDPESAYRRDTEAAVERLDDRSRIRYVRHDRNRGGGAARNTGIRAATAPYVAFLDDDDVWYPTKLERQLAVIEAAPEQVALVYCPFKMVNLITGREVVRRTDGNSHSVKDLLRRNTVGTTSCVLCRTSALHDVGLFDDALPARQDQDLFLRLAERYEFRYVDEVLVTMYLHGRPRISTDSEGSIRAHELFHRKHKALIDADPDVLRVMHHQLGKHLLTATRYAEARTVLLQAWRARPLDLTVLARLAMTFALPRACARPALWARARVRRARYAREARREVRR